MFENKKILITGADGFIGSHLTEYLVRNGSDVRAFCLYNSFGSWGWLDSSEKNDLFDQKRETHNMICVSHNGGVIKKFCDYAAILRDGKLEVYEDIEEALSIYKNL